MKPEEIKKTLDNHRHWLREDCDGWKEIAEYEEAMKKPKDTRVKSVRTSSGVRFGGYRRGR